MHDLQDGYLDLAKLATYSSMGRTTLKELIHAGELLGYSPRGKILVLKSEFDEWVKKHPVRSGKAVANIVNELMVKQRK